MGWSFRVEGKGNRGRRGKGISPYNLLIWSWFFCHNFLQNIVHFCRFKMSEENVQSRYVRLTKDQAPAEDINPGELNQPIQVPQLIVHRCPQCQQPLPESYEPPADEDWTSGIFGCAKDTDNCWTGLFCPCVLFGRNVETLREDIPWQNACVCHAMCVEGGMVLAAATAMFHGIDPKTSFLICESLLFAWWMCGIYTGLFRQSLQTKYHLKNSPCDPCLVHCCLHWCALCQEHREMKSHLSDYANTSLTIVNPPPVQEMDSNGQRESVVTSVSAPSTENGGRTNLQLQPV